MPAKSIKPVKNKRRTFAIPEDPTVVVRLRVLPEEFELIKKAAAWD
jgi:hypothetical protein